MRIISGCCKGRKLVKLSGSQIRPTSDRTREAVFNILGPKVRTARVLDLFAGTGALGMEALSRGSLHATFIDLFCDVLHQNLELCRFKEKARVICRDIVTHDIFESLNKNPFDLVFIDPPYGKGYIPHILSQKSFTDLLARDGIIIAEQSCKETLENIFPGLDIYRQKKYSKTNIYFIKKNEKG